MKCRWVALSLLLSNFALAAEPGWKWVRAAARCDNLLAVGADDQTFLSRDGGRTVGTPLRGKVDFVGCDALVLDGALSDGVWRTDYEAVPVAHAARGAHRFEPAEKTNAPRDQPLLRHYEWWRHQETLVGYGNQEMVISWDGGAHFQLANGVVKEGDQLRMDDRGFLYHWTESCHEEGCDSTRSIFPPHGQDWQSLAYGDPLEGRFLDKVEGKKDRYYEWAQSYPDECALTTGYLGGTDGRLLLKAENGVNCFQQRVASNGDVVIAEDGRALYRFETLRKTRLATVPEDFELNTVDSRGRALGISAGRVMRIDGHVIFTLSLGQH